MLPVKPTDEEKLHDFFRGQLIGFKLLLDNQLTLPVLILLYASIDISAYVWAGGDDNRAGERFKKFAEKYIISHLPELTPADLWGARCAILHTSTPESTESKKGSARQILYSWGSAEIEINKKVIAAETDKYVATSIEDLLKAFASAIDDFMSDLEKDDGLYKLCMERVRKFYAAVPIPVK
jgi:hypothetical protein